MKTVGYWIEAMRLRTLPVSVSGVLAAVAFAVMDGSFNMWPALLCLLFAVLAQVASNFANEYFDYKSGVDSPGREGPRRGVTEGEIKPGAMKAATFITLGVACAVGLSLIAWGGWWLLAAGATIALGVLAYSAGPYPLSHHALGEVAVICYFGIIPVNLTFYLQTGAWDMSVFMGSLAIGLMGANVLLVNNYRDRSDDAAVGKQTLAVVAGPNTASTIYLINGWLVPVLLLGPLAALPRIGAWVLVVAYLAIHTMLWCKMLSRRGAALNPLLGATAMLMLVFTLGFLALTAGA